MASQSKLRALGYASYSDYLRSPHWKSVKAAYRSSELPQACMCGEVEVDLHHITYDRLGAELLTDFVPMCRRCHAALHVLERRGDIGLDPSGLKSDTRSEQYAREQAPRNVTAIREYADTREPVVLSKLSLSERLRRIELAHNRGQIDASRGLAAIRRRIVQLERLLDQVRAEAA